MPKLQLSNGSSSWQYSSTYIAISVIATPSFIFWQITAT